MGESTRAGKLLYWSVASVAVGALLSLAVSIPGWVDAWGAGERRGLLILAGFIGATIACFAGAAAVYVLLARALEARGVSLKGRPREGGDPV
jgi:hypothetical protein